MAQRVYPLVVSIQAPSSDGKYWGRYPQGNKPAGITGAGAINASASAVYSPVYFSENYDGVPAGNVSLTSAWTNKGYSDFDNSGTGANVTVLARASMPSGLLADPRFPSRSTKQTLRFTLAANEIIARLLWSGLPAGVTTASFSWWEYRSAANLGGEKFCRVGNFLLGIVGNNRGLDTIITLGQVSATTLIANSANMHDYGDHPMSPGISGWPGLNHFEMVVNLSTGTNAGGSVSFYENGALVGQATGLQFFNTTSQASIGLQLFDTGGWSSTGSGNEGTVTYPIVRDWCAFRVAAGRQGVWALT